MSHQALYISHGAGPLPLLGDERHVPMTVQLQRLATEIPKPSAIIVVSAHWEANPVRVTADVQPDLLYDYYGFPDDAYRIEYPCPGAPQLASRTVDALQRAGIDAALETGRGLDHGVFVPLKLMYPQATIPCIELSLMAGLDPATHIQVGQALRVMADEGVLLVGSGSSFHNMRPTANYDLNRAQVMNSAFEQWLETTCADPNLSETQRTQRFVAWEDAPHARYCHPREEHLLPLHVCYGFAGTACAQVHALDMFELRNSIYVWNSEKG